MASTNVAKFAAELKMPADVLLEHRELGELREFCLLTTLRNVHGIASWLIFRSEKNDLSLFPQ